MSNVINKEIQFGADVLTLETGRMARQAHSVVAKMGGTVVLASVVASKEPVEGVDFLPLSVHYLEKYYAAGKFPGSFFKREGRPTEREVLTSRLIDRTIRPLFPEGFYNEVQVTVILLSYDPKAQPDVVAGAAVSAALSISGLPFNGPIGIARVGHSGGELVLNPPAYNSKDANEKLDLIVAGTGTKDAVLMVESEAKELSEEVMLEAMMFGHDSFQVVIKGIKEFAKEVGVAKQEVTLASNADLVKKVDSLIGADLRAAYKVTEKQARYAAIDVLKGRVKEALVEKEGLDALKVKGAFKALQSDIVRKLALSDKVRIDGRGPSDIRRIDVEVGVLPSVHGSALFTRGETQAMVVTTLGSGDDEQIVDDVEGVRKDGFMLHYNFPPFSVGEVGRVGAPGRREIGHGKLAFRALAPLLPTKDVFPYTVRVVSEILESNGSSSMATVCGASLSLMDAGVPLPKPVAGIAMGLIMEGKNCVVLSDIMGDEDHLGDMDFKVAGTQDGITALQMDIKIEGITPQVMKDALEQARVGRAHILECMTAGLTESRGSISKNAPQIRSLKIPKDKIGKLIGPGGEMIKSIVEQTKVKIDISDDGTVNVASVSAEGMEAALALINDIAATPEIGKVYEGKVVKITDFGAFVGIMRNTEGLVHVSEMAHKPVRHPRDVVSEGQRIQVQVIDIDKTGRIKLSMKAVPGSADGAAEVTQDEVSVDSPKQHDERGSNDRRNEKGARHESGGRGDKNRDHKSNDRSKSTDRNDGAPRKKMKRPSDRDSGPRNKAGEEKKLRFF